MGIQPPHPAGHTMARVNPWAVVGLSKRPASPTSATGRGCGNPEMHKVGCRLLVQWLRKAGIAVALSPMALCRLGCICAWVGRVSAGAGAVLGTAWAIVLGRSQPCRSDCQQPQPGRIPAFGNNAVQRHPAPTYPEITSTKFTVIVHTMFGVVPICCRWLLFSPVQPRTQNPAHSPAGLVAFPTRGRCRLPHFCTGAVLPCGRAQEFPNMPG